MRIPVVAIFDIGKTNKKLLVFDERYNVVKEELVRFEETTDEDGFACEDIEQLSAWILSKFDELKNSDELLLKCVNFSTYGASLVHLDAQGNRVGRLYNYLKPYPDDLRDEFVKTYGAGGQLSEETCSPIMGHLNAGMQLYWLKKRRPDLYARISNTLHFPQYLSFLLTGQKFAETTNVGCHSAMWNFKQMQYHSWLQKEGIRQKLSEITPGSHAVRIKDNKTGNEIAVGIGLHDSSAAIIPYLRSFTEPFVILSTGTWTISLNPFNQNLPDADELSKGCVSYLSYQGKPVKTSMLFAGNEHDLQVTKIAAHFHVAPDFFKTLKADRRFLSSGSIPARPFHERDVNDFHSAEEAYHELIAGLVNHQVIFTNMVLKNSHVQNIYVDGGFCKNQIYMQRIADVFSDKNVYAASMIQGTSLGAALAVHAHWNTQVADGLLQLKKWKSLVTDNAHS